jgi:predicted DNA-binding antitoxin AbrB/MazE fold protein
MARTIEAVYEDGVFKPLEPVKLENGQKVQVHLPCPTGPILDEEAQTLLRQTQQLYDGLTEKEIEQLETIVLERCNSRTSAPAGQS